ncbi:MAG: hypothetical protein WD795_16515 [Woeseia sp.]
MAEPLDLKGVEPTTPVVAAPVVADPAAAPAPAPAPPPAAADAAQSDFAVTVPENVAALRKDNFFDPDKTFAQDIGMESVEVPPEQLQAANTELRRLAGDVGLSSGEARDIAGLMKAAAVELPTDEQQSAWRAEATANLSRTYGSRANEALVLAQKLVQRDGRLLALIDAHELGNHPKVIALLAAKAFDEQKKGRL